jgi:hypothetical protein
MMQMTCTIVFSPAGGAYVAKEIVLLFLKQGLDIGVAKMGTKLHRQTDEYYDNLHLYLPVELCWVSVLIVGADTIGYVR